MMPGTDQRPLSGDGRGPPTNDEWLATNVEVQELAAANPAVAPHSCSFCREWELDLRQDNFGNITQRNLGETRSGFNLSYAREMAGTGCPFFERSLQLESGGMKDDAVVSVFASDLDSEPEVSINWKDDRNTDRSAVYEVYLPHGTPLHPPTPWAETLTRPDIRPSIDWIAVRVPPNLVPNSSLSYRRVKGWIDECSSNHVKCSSRPRDFMPSRVLHISGTGEEPTIRLSSDHPPAPYVVLSYCWGAEQPAKTTRANLSSYLSDIDVSTLSATVRDAAIVTRGIGLSYLWVDAMCIIQDDFDDVMEQVAQMHSIYHCSWLTIAAVEAPTCNHGFLQPRAQWQPLRMRARLDGGDPSDVLLAPKNNNPVRGNAALFQRGWTMQEMLLSSRILLYGQRELIYLCLEAERCEGAVPSEVRRLGAHYDPVDSIYSDLNHPETWGRVVVTYTQRQLSVDDDRLLAVGALAEAYGRNNGVSGYAAGMWREDFLYQCLWTTDRFAYDGVVPRHPSVYTAPSWSWASIVARIRMLGQVGNVPAMIMPGTMPPTITCEVVDIRTTLLVAGNPFGVVTDGELVIRGKMRRVVWESGDLWREKGRLAKDADTDGRMLFTLDCPHDWSGADDVLLWSLELCEPDDGHGYALLLQEAGHPKGLFQRVGLLGIVKMQRLGLPNWFESEYELREITII